MICLIIWISFTHVWFCSTVHWSLRKYWFTELNGSSKCYRISLYNIKNCFIDITTNIMRKLLIIGKLFTEGRSKFSEIIVFTWKLYFLLLATNTVIILKVTGSIHSFCRKYLPKFLSLNNHSLSVNRSFKQKLYFMNKQLVWLTTQLHRCFSSRLLLYFGM